jgi:hypothetical protein
MPQPPRENGSRVERDKGGRWFVVLRGELVFDHDTTLRYFATEDEAETFMRVEDAKLG